jgi:ATP/maltotriose-dependent transcriptional regulator MalT
MQERDIYKDLGLDLPRAWAVFESATVETLAGNIDDAEAELRWSCELLERKEEKAVYPTILALLADVRYMRDDIDEAAILVGRAEELAVEDDLLTQIKCRAVKAKVAAARGSMEEALSLARQASEIAERTEYLDWRANTWMDLAAVAQQDGRVDVARQAMQAAIDLYDRKEMPFLSRKAAEQLAALVG